MPKHTDDPRAREAAQGFIDNNGPSTTGTDAVIALFPTVEFENGSARVGGETVNLRRVVLVGPWEATSGEDRQ